MTDLSFNEIKKRLNRFLRSSEVGQWFTITKVIKACETVEDPSTRAMIYRALEEYIACAAVTKKLVKVSTGNANKYTVTNYRRLLAFSESILKEGKEGEKKKISPPKILFSRNPNNFRLHVANHLSFIEKNPELKKKLEKKWTRITSGGERFGGEFETLELYIKYLKLRNGDGMMKEEKVNMAYKNSKAYCSICHNYQRQNEICRTKLDQQEKELQRLRVDLDRAEKLNEDLSEAADNYKSCLETEIENVAKFEKQIKELEAKLGKVVNIEYHQNQGRQRR